MKWCVAICGGREVITDFVRGGGGGGQIDPLPVGIGLMYHKEFGILQHARHPKGHGRY